MRPSRVALLVATAVLAGVAGVASAAAPAVNHAATTVVPAVAPAAETSTVVIAGKGFAPATTTVTFGDCGGGTVDAARSTATKLVVTAPACPAGRPGVAVSTAGANPATVNVAAAKFAFAVRPSAPVLQPATGPWAGGQSAAAVLDEGLPATSTVKVRLSRGAISKDVAAKVDAKDTKRVTFKTPAWPPGPVDVQVLAAGIVGAKAVSGYTYASTVKVTPSTWVAGAATPEVRVDGKGFGTDASQVSVTVCGVAATVLTSKGVKDTTLWFTAPAAAALPLTDGAGPCTVRVTAAGRASVVTAGSTFTYAAL